MSGTATPTPRREATATLVRSTVVVAAIRGIDIGLSFLVSVLLANRFGTSGQLDAFFLARRTTVGFADAIRKLVGHIVMPSVVSKIDRGEHLSIHGLPRRVYVFVILFVLLTLAGTLVPSALVSAFAPGFTGERHDLTARMMAIMMPLLPVAVIGSLLVSVLQANRRYWLSEGTNIVQRAILVFVLAVAIPPLGIIAGAWTMLVSGIVGTAILFVGAWPIVRRRPESLLAPQSGDDTEDGSQVGAQTGTGVSPAAALGGGVAAAIVLNAYFQACSLLDFAVASTVPAGGVAALEYGARLVSLVPGLLMSSLNTVLQPELVRAMQHPDPAEASTGLARFQRIAFFAQMPVSIGMMIGAQLMVTILFGHGAFDAHSIALASGTTAGYAAAAIFLAPMGAITLAIYADPRAPSLRDLLVIAIGGLAIRGLMLAFAAPAYGAVGIAWAAAVSTLLAFALAQFVATRRFREFDMIVQLVDFARTALCGAVAAAGAYSLWIFAPAAETTFARLLLLIAIGGVVVALYIGAAILLHVPELAKARTILGGIAARKFKRRAA
jgi:putative peptidoglycan lipid II flippase